MKMRMKIILVVVIIVIISLFTGCEKVDNCPFPIMPPVELTNIDFEEYQ